MQIYVLISKFYPKLKKKKHLNVSILMEKINICSLIRCTPNEYCELNIHKHYDSGK